MKLSKKPVLRIEVLISSFTILSSLGNGLNYPVALTVTADFLRLVV
jgi:hypothetical protein